MNSTCKNCNDPLNGNFCSNCGQSSHSDRIDMHYISHEIQHGIFHVDKGILYTIKELAIHPGKMLREYLKGKRVKHFKPFGFVVILASLYGLLAHYFHLYPDLSFLESPDNVAYTKKYNEWVYTHYSLFSLLCTPVYAFFSYLVFKKLAYNYLEHLIINLYITGFQIAIGICILPLHYFFPVFSYLLISILSFIYFCIAYVSIFNFENKIITLGKCMIIYVLTLLVSGIVGGIAGSLFFAHS